MIVEVVFLYFIFNQEVSLMFRFVCSDFWKGQGIFEGGSWEGIQVYEVGCQLFGFSNLFINRI